ncbi:unnamed protein product [Cyclocybe aegerita]|uniref:Uncharacterized protein n=1 Tax=Cyclocybe aegerita TaxID=1973307 RepID=A0A8S0XM64_CYCAE|nr:unnamed protein product [Cyclocybe aegerita]
MPSTLGEPAPRNWWSLSRSPSGKDLHSKFTQEKPMRRSAPGLSFNSFASAIGLKTKKHHIAIQEPPSPVDPHPPPLASPRSTGTRPASKAASSTRSRVDSLEPRTPLDYQHRDRRHSLLTLSDTDPFAGRPPTIAAPLPHTPSDPNRLSAYSNPSVTDFAHRKGTDPPPFNRVSYASTSSNSHELVPAVPFSPPPKGSSDVRKLHTKRSAGSLQVQRSDLLSRQTSIPSPTSPAPSSALPNSAQSRPKLRARGMTDTGTSHKAGFFVEDRSASRKSSQKATSPKNPTPSSPHDIQLKPETPISPRVVIRQPSVSRFQSPPSAPPVHSLPATPNPIMEEPPRNRAGIGAQTEPAPRTSSSSSISLTNDMFAVPFQGTGPFSQTIHDYALENDSKTAPSSPRTLRKALSQSSLNRRNAPYASPTPSIPKTSPLQLPAEKVKKQRSFHHPRLPIPPVPLSIRTSTSSNSTSFPSLSDFGSPPPSDHRTSSTSSFGRKRLFSNSSQRPSTSQCVPTSAREDDSLSIFSLRSDPDSHLGPYKHWPSNITASPPVPTSSSFWDEGSPDIGPTSPSSRSQSEYMPQAILSRDELAKIEASVESLNTLEPASTSYSTANSNSLSGSGSNSRSRGFSLLSASTVASELDMEEEHTDRVPVGLSPPPSARPGTRQRSLRMSAQSASSAHSKASNRSGVSSGGGSRASSPPPPQPSRSTSGTGSGNIRRNADASTRGGGGAESAAIGHTGVAQVAMRVPSPSSGSFMTSLPPPPRHRQRTRVSSKPDLPGASISSTASTVTPTPPIPSPIPSFAPISSPTPPPTSLTPSPSITPTPSPLIPFTPPPLHLSSFRKSGASSSTLSMRSKSSVERAMHRRSIMRKPSFLEIEDDSDQEDIEDVVLVRPGSSGLVGGLVRPPPSVGEEVEEVSASFLDLARESFETARSER